MRAIADPPPEMYSIATLECWYDCMEMKQKAHFYDRSWQWADWAMVMAIFGFWALIGICAFVKWR